MKIFKEDSEMEKRVQQVEALCNQLQLRILYTYNGLCVQDTHTGNVYPLLDTTSPNDKQTDFPRCFDSIRIVVPV